MIRAFLYDATGEDREVSLDRDALSALGDNHILWADVTAPTPQDMAALVDAFGLGAECVASLRQARNNFALDNYSDYFHCDLLAVLAPTETQGRLPRVAKAARLDFVVAPQWLITVHAEDLPFLQEFRDQDKGETLIGGLTGPQVAASLLDWHLEAYLGALENVELYADALDTRILARIRVREALLGEIVLGRRYVSSLRRLLGPQRSIFYGASRPDFTQIANTGSAVHYQALERRFERTLDAIEHGRELMQSSFDLFTTRVAETTNTLIRRLTFLSVLLGATAAVAGLLGMNFPPPYAKGGAEGFWIVIGALAMLTIGAITIARLRKWI